MRKIKVSAHIDIVKSHMDAITRQHDYKDIEIYSFQLSIATIIFPSQYQTLIDQSHPNN